MVHVPALIEAIKALAWRKGLVTVEGITCNAEQDGSYTITIKIPGILVDPKSIPPKAEPTSKPLRATVAADISKRST